MDSGSIAFHPHDRRSPLIQLHRSRFPAAFGLMVTLIWLYLEILRLLTKLRRR